MARGCQGQCRMFKKKRIKWMRGLVGWDSQRKVSGLLHRYQGKGLGHMSTLGPNLQWPEHFKWPQNRLVRSQPISRPLVHHGKPLSGYFGMNSNFTIKAKGFGSTPFAPTPMQRPTLSTPVTCFAQFYGVEYEIFFCSRPNIAR